MGRPQSHGQYAHASPGRVPAHKNPAYPAEPGGGSQPLCGAARSQHVSESHPGCHQNSAQGSLNEMGSAHMSPWAGCPHMNIRRTLQTCVEKTDLSMVWSTLSLVSDSLSHLHKTRNTQLPHTAPHSRGAFIGAGCRQVKPTPIRCILSIRCSSRMG